MDRDLQAANGPVALAARKDPCRARPLPQDSASPSIDRCDRRIFSMPRDDVEELLRTAAGRELNRGLEILPDLNGGVSWVESYAEFAGADLAKSEAVAGASQRGDRRDQGQTIMRH